MRLNRLISTVALMVFVVSAVIWIVGTLALRPAHRTVGPAPFFLKAEKQVLRQNDSPDLVGWKMPARAPFCGVAILLHGRGAARDQMLGRATLLTAAGFDVYAFDFQGHGESGGDTLGFGYAEATDVKRIVEAARRARPEAPIGVVGLSLGGAAAVQAGEQEGVRAYVLEGLYATLLKTTARRVPSPVLTELAAWLVHLQTPIRLGFSASEMRPVDRIAEIKKPILLIAGGADPLAPLSEAEQLRVAATPWARLMVMETAGHVDFYNHDRTAYAQAVLPFLRGALCPRGAA